MASYSQRTVVNKNGKETQKWRVLFIDATGRRKEFNGKSKKEVKAKMDEWNKQIALYGNPLSKDNYTVGEWLENHLFINKHGKIAHSTFQTYKTILDQHIKRSTLGKMDLKDVRQIDVQKFLNSKDSFSYSTLKKFYILLSQCFDSAQMNQLIRVNPADGVTIPNKSKKPKEIQALTLSQQAAYINALKGEQHEVLLLTALFTGLRLGELTGLKWGHVNLATKEIEVKESIRRVKVYDKNGVGKNQVITKPPKSRAGLRTVPLPDFLVDLLKKQRPNDVSDDTYVFLTKHGNPHTARNVQKYHSRICTKAKINPITDDKGKTTYMGINFHGLRHTYATRMIESGETIKTVQDLLGHQDAQTTLNIYTHTLPEIKKASADKQNALFHMISKI